MFDVQNHGIGKLSLKSVIKQLHFLMLSMAIKMISLTFSTFVALSSILGLCHCLRNETFYVNVDSPTMDIVKPCVLSLNTYPRLQHGIPVSSVNGWQTFRTTIVKTYLENICTTEAVTVAKSLPCVLLLQSTDTRWKGRRECLKKNVAVNFIRNSGCNILLTPEYLNNIQSLLAGLPSDLQIWSAADESCLRLLPNNSKVQLTMVNNTVPRSTPPTALAPGNRTSSGAREYLDMGIFLTFIVLFFIICIVIIIKFRLRRRRRAAMSLSQLAKKAVKQMHTRKYKGTFKVYTGSERAPRPRAYSSDSDHKSLDSAAEMCVICLEEYTEGQEVRMLPCGHEFHKACVDPWLLGACTCPLCMFNIVEPTSCGHQHAAIRPPLREPPLGDPPPPYTPPASLEGPQSPASPVHDSNNSNTQQSRSSPWRGSLPAYSVHYQHHDSTAQLHFRSPTQQRVTCSGTFNDTTTAQYPALDTVCLRYGEDHSGDSSSHSDPHPVVNPLYVPVSVHCSMPCDITPPTTAIYTSRAETRQQQHDSTSTDDSLGRTSSRRKRTKRSAGGVYVRVPQDEGSDSSHPGSTVGEGSDSSHPGSTVDSGSLRRSSPTASNTSQACSITESLNAQLPTNSDQASLNDSTFSSRESCIAMIQSRSQADRPVTSKRGKDMYSSCPAALHRSDSHSHQALI